MPAAAGILDGPRSASFSRARTRRAAGPRSCGRRRRRRRRTDRSRSNLMTEPSGARLPRGKRHGAGQAPPRGARAVGIHDDVLRRDGRRRAAGRSRRAVGAARSSPTSPARGPASPPLDRQRRLLEQTEASAGAASPPARRRQGTRAPPSGGGPFGKRVDQAGHAAVHADPVFHRRPSQSRPRGRWRACAGSKISSNPPKAACTTIALRIAASVTIAGGGPRPRAARLTRRARAERARHVHPDRLARRRQRGVRQRKAERPRRSPGRSPPCRGTGSRRPASRRRGSRGPAPARASASPWAKGARRSTGPCPRPSAVPRRQRHAAGHQHHGQRAHRGPASSSSSRGRPLCRRWRRRGRPCASAASVPGGAAPIAASLR